MFHEEKIQLLDHLFFPDGGNIIPVQRRSICRESGVAKPVSIAVRTRVARVARAVSIGVVVHSRSWTAGHGPGVVTLFTSREGRIETEIDPDANLGKLLKIRR